MRHNKCVSMCPKKEEKPDHFFPCATECIEEDFLVLNAMDKHLANESKSAN